MTDGFTNFALGAEAATAYHVTVTSLLADATGTHGAECHALVIDMAAVCVLGTAVAAAARGR